MSVDSTGPGRSWVWFPSTHDLKTHYVRTMTDPKCSSDEAILISKCRLSCENWVFLRRLLSYAERA